MVLSKLDLAIVAVIATGIIMAVFSVASGRGRLYFALASLALAQRRNRPERDRMTLDRAWLRLALFLACVLAVPGLSHAGGVSFSDDDSGSDDEGPTYFGFVREVDGPGISDAKVTAELDKRGALVTRTDIMGVYKIPGFGKDVDPKEVAISCAKEGYKQASVVRRPSSDPKDPIEIECYLQKQ